MSKRILFVDDEPMVLSGIERSLRSMRKEWQMEFVGSGNAALQTMERDTFDVVVTDMRMPGMDGAQLLQQVRQHFPQTVRMILSGQSDREAVFRCIGPAHQYLSKPCDVEHVKEKLARTFALRDLLQHPKLKQVVSTLEGVPSSPVLLKSLKFLLDSPNPSLAEVSSLVERDMGMTSRVLQIVNCAFLGSATQVASAKQAVATVGIDSLKILVHSLGLFSEFLIALPDNLTDPWSHSLATAQAAKAIAELEKADAYTIDCAFTAGLLHDIGHIILAASREEFCLTASQGGADFSGSWETFDEIHPQIGGYLLGLWGLPTPIVEAVVWHHQPKQSKSPQFSPLIAVHVADSYVQRNQPNRSKRGLDPTLIDHLGLQDRMPVWMEACFQIEAGKTNE